MKGLISNSDGSLTCSCGAELFSTMGDNFGITIIECVKCNNRTSIIESTLIAEKLLSPLGEDFCRPYANIESDVLFVDRLVYTEFQTEVSISASDRLALIRTAKEEAIKNEWFERAARLREEENIVERILRQISKLLGR